MQAKLAFHKLLSTDKSQTLYQAELRAQGALAGIWNPEPINFFIDFPGRELDRLTY